MHAGGCTASHRAVSALKRARAGWRAHPARRPCRALRPDVPRSFRFGGCVFLLVVLIARGLLPGRLLPIVVLVILVCEGDPGRPAHTQPDPHRWTHLDQPLRSLKFQGQSLRSMRAATSSPTKMHVLQNAAPPPRPSAVVAGHNETPSLATYSSSSSLRAEANNSTTCGCCLVHDGVVLGPLLRDLQR